jgi:hypothetical protein
VNWPATFSLAIVFFGAASTVMHALWALRWWRQHAPALASLDAVLAVSWLVIVATYALNRAELIDITLWGTYTVRPLVAVLALAQAVKLVIRYQQERGREALVVTVERATKRAERVLNGDA